MFKQKNYLALGAVTLVALLIFSLPPRATARLKLAVGSLFLPLFGLAGAAQQLPAGSRRHRSAPPRTACRLTANLRRENEQLKVAALQAAAIGRENDELRAALGWQRQMPWRLKLANVVLRDPANWWRTVQIDLGTRDGVVEKPAGADRRRPGRPRFVRLAYALASGFDRRSQLPRLRAGRKSGA